MYFHRNMANIFTWSNLNLIPQDSFGYKAVLERVDPTQVQPSVECPALELNALFLFVCSYILQTDEKLHFHQHVTPIFKSKSTLLVAGNGTPKKHVKFTF